MSYEGLQTPLQPKDAGADEVFKCESTFLYIVMGFAVINILFAWFLQNQVWKQIMKREADFIDGDKPSAKYAGKMPAAAKGALGSAFAAGAQAAGRADLTAPIEVSKEPPAQAPGKIIVPKEITQEAFKKVFMEDFVVLFMFIALIGMFVLSWKGQDKVDTSESRCDVGNAQYCGYAYFWVAFVYSFAYYCCQCCSASVTMKKPERDEEALD